VSGASSKLDTSGAQVAEEQAVDRVEQGGFDLMTVGGENVLISVSEITEGVIAGVGQRDASPTK
jgi:hypothetical protein